MGTRQGPVERNQSWSCFRLSSLVPPTCFRERGFWALNEPNASAVPHLRHKHPDGLVCARPVSDPRVTAGGSPRALLGLSTAPPLASHSQHSAGPLQGEEPLNPRTLGILAKLLQRTQ